MEWLRRRLLQTLHEVERTRDLGRRRFALEGFEYARRTAGDRRVRYRQQSGSEFARLVSHQFAVEHEQCLRRDRGRFALPLSTLGSAKSKTWKVRTSAPHDGKINGAAVRLVNLRIEVGGAGDVASIRRWQQRAAITLFNWPLTAAANRERLRLQTAAVASPPQALSGSARMQLHCGLCPFDRPPTT